MPPLLPALCLLQVQEDLPAAAAAGGGDAEMADAAAAADSNAENRNSANAEAAGAGGDKAAPAAGEGQGAAAQGPPAKKATKVPQQKYNNVKVGAECGPGPLVGGRPAGKAMPCEASCGKREQAPVWLLLR